MSHIEVWMQDSPIKGLRTVRFLVEDETPNLLIWLGDDEGNGDIKSSKYSRRELIENKWEMMEIHPIEA